MGLYDKFARLARQREQFHHSGLTPFGTCIDEIYSATEGRIGNNKVLLAGTNNYLGLTFNQQAIAASQAAVAAQGTGTTGSRMANGSYGAHLALEQELALFLTAHRHRILHWLYRQSGHHQHAGHPGRRGAAGCR